MRISGALWVLCVGAAIVLGSETVKAAGVGERCGGASKMRCERGLWCDPRPGRCGIRRAPGRCVEVPQFCTMIYQPVCGCDGKTYSNDCVRRGARVAKRHDGEC